jgi:putative transposase
LFKTELIRRRGPWRGLEDVELAALEWVDWFNHRRLHSYCHDLPPAEFEDLYHPQNNPPATAEMGEPSLH